MQDQDLINQGVWASRQQLRNLDSRSWLEPPCVIQATLAFRNRINIGSFTGLYGGRIGHACIGRYCSISYNVDISSDQHPTDWLSTSMTQYVDDVHGWETWFRNSTHQDTCSAPKSTFVSNSPAIIGNDVWIGQGAFIRSGVSIGHGAIIAAHAVVVKDVEPYTIVAGVPARAIRSRFPEVICDKLLNLKWWDYNICFIPGLEFHDINKCIDVITKCRDNGIIHPYQPNLIYTNQL